MRNLFYKVMDLAHEGITISDATKPDNPLIYVNQGFTTMTGYTSEEILGKNCRFLQGGETSGENVELISRAIRNGEPIQLELVNYRKNGERFWNHLSLTPVINEMGVITNFIGIQEDITAKKEKSRLEIQLSKSKLNALSAIAAREEERNRIGRELHDNINQMVATISLYTNCAIEMEDRRLDMLIRTKKLTNEIIEETRKVSKALVGPAFEVVEFKLAVMEMIDSIQIAVPYQIKVIDNELDESLLNGNQKLLLFRIIQEQLTNIQKYAWATSVSIQMCSREGMIRLKVQDNGSGFNTSAPRSGIGFRNISKRLEAENGSFNIISSPGKGCELQVSFEITKNILNTEIALTQRIAI